MGMRKRSYLALAVGFAGFLLAIDAANGASRWELSVALVVGGTIAFFGSIVAVYFVFGDDIPVGLPDDERTRQIEFRAARNAFIVLLVVLNALVLSWEYVPWSVPGDSLLLGVQFTLLGSYFGWYEWYKRRM